ncbi:UrcA family protein [Henriciella barbarensis]|uniref:UrcA family protein n=1 Tax=Henriciella barbarensis TaxID=86342 RepID=A0A399R0A7_9PROT|nr:UrcA family protein [Henriciella barbarensis]RIJ23735.1 UrcA family protein [Henriciella barbarensis]
MKYLAATAAICLLPAWQAGSAQSYGCSELTGGGHVQTCGSSTSATKIIRVERQAYGHPPAPTNHHSSGDHGTRSAVRHHPGGYAHHANNYYGHGHHPVRHADRAATSYGFEWWTSDRYYGHGYRPTTSYQTHYPVHHGRNIGVYNGTRTYVTTPVSPCSYSVPRVTTSYSGCGGTVHSSAPRVTTYSAPVTHSSRTVTNSYAAHGDNYGHEGPYYDDYTPVVARASGYCAQEITALGEDRRGRQRYEVCYRDLSPVDDARGIEILYSRIARAADAACDANRGSLSYQRAERRCEAVAIERAVYDTGIEALQRHYLISTGQGAPRVTVGPLRRY